MGAKGEIKCSVRLQCSDIDRIGISTTSKTILQHEKTVWEYPRAAARNSKMNENNKSTRRRKRQDILHRHNVANDGLIARERSNSTTSKIIVQHQKH